MIALLRATSPQSVRKWMVFNEHITLIHIPSFASVSYLERARELTNVHATCCNGNAHSMTGMLRLGRLCARIMRCVRAPIVQECKRAGWYHGHCTAIDRGIYEYT
jgi:hypothetical protein